MGLLSTVTGWLTGGVLNAGGDLVEKVGGVFKPNAEKQAQRGHEGDMESLRQFAAEFHARGNRSWWDSFVDGLNRLPRPLIALSVLGIFFLAPYDPVYFLKIAKSYEVMPPGFWALASIIVGFFFGGRISLSKQDMVVQGGALAAAKDMVEQRKAFRELAADDEDQAPGVEVTGENSVVKKWLEKQAS